MKLCRKSWLSALILVVIFGAHCQDSLAAELDGFDEEEGAEPVTPTRPRSFSQKATEQQQPVFADEDLMAMDDEAPHVCDPSQGDECPADAGAVYQGREPPPPQAKLRQQQQQAASMQQPQQHTQPPQELPFPQSLMQKFMPKQGPVKIDYWREACLAGFLAIYLINILVGWRRNYSIAAAFARTFAAPTPAASDAPPSLLHSQFASVHAFQTGAKGVDSVLKGDGMSQYKLYATGRRHCQYLLATLNLRARQDLISQLWYTFQPMEDTLYVELAVAEATMPPVVLVAATPRVAKRMAAELKDVAAFAHSVAVGSDHLPKWPTERVSILAEHSSVAYEVLSDPRIAAALQADAAGPRLFRSLHISSELTTTASTGKAAEETASLWGITTLASALPAGTKCGVRFEFALPSNGDMGALAKLMALVPIVVDSVGVFKASPDMKKRLAEQRAKVEERAAKESSVAEEASKKAAKRREEKQAAEKEKLARMTPEARAKALEKQDRRDREKQMKKHIRKM